MPLSIKDPRTDRLARELAQSTGESITEAVAIALEERLRRVTARRRARSLADELDEIARRCDRILSDRWLEIDLLATWLRSVGVTTIQQLRKLFTEKREAIIDLACSRLSHKDPFTHGVSILYVCYYVAAREGGAKRITDFLESNQFGPPAEIEKVAAQIMDKYSAYSGGDTAHPKPVTK